MNGDEASDKQEHKSDVLFVHSPTESGDGLRVIRAREEGLQFGELKAVKEGEPIQGDLLKLKQRKESGRLFDVEVVLSQQELGPHARKAAGPAQVASDAYLRNWDAIFGGAKKDSLPN